MEAKKESNVQLFDNENFSARVALKDGEPMFCLADVCKCLDLQPSRVKDRLDDGVTCTHPILDSLGRTQEATFVTEDGLYDVILDSRKPAAKAMRKWVTSIVLPSIRKNGAYVKNQEVLSPEEIIKRGYESLLKICEEQKQQLEVQKPKVEYFDALIERDLNVNLRDTAHEIGVKQNEFIDFLLNHNYVYRHMGKQIKPYAQYVGELFVVKEYSNEKHSGVQTLVTPKGRAYFKRVMDRLAS